MRVPLEWLRDYVDIDVDAATLAHDLTMSGTKIEAVHGAAPAFEGVFVGKVLERAKHPGADKLSVCEVEVAGERLHIVCGAPNVRAGLTVAVARVGARLPGDLRIRKSKIRGEVSEGMICSARELGLGSDSDGILELEATLVSGADFRTIAGGSGAVLEAEITPNRPDCLSVLGIAREVAAVYGLRLRRPPVWEAPASLAPVRVPVEIESKKDCGRYLGRCVHEIRVGPSPSWMQARLRAVGASPINNIVDVTNYVLFETGQPLHAFDLAQLRGPRIVVRRARAGEELVTLDGVARQLDADILVIADDEIPVAVAGVMGGAASAVTDGTRSILLESAHFDPQVVRTGRRKLGLDTDASYRFERQADLGAAGWAADRATQLLLETASGRVREIAADERRAVQPSAPLRLRVERANRLIGTTLDAAAMAQLLERLELDAEPLGEAVQVRVPSFRRDLHAEIDLVEEVARVHGYERIESRVMPPAPLVYERNLHDEHLARLRQAWISAGFYEVRTSAFMEREDPERLSLPAEDVRRRAVRIVNPIVTSLGTMRTSLLPGLLRVLRHNRNHDSEQLRFVAVDRVFLDEAGPYPGLPSEPESVVVVASGASAPPGWGTPRRDFDLYDLKGEVEALLAQLDVDTTWTYGYTEPFLIDGASFLIAGTYGNIGRGGAVREEVLRAFDLEPSVFTLELDVAALEKHLDPTRRHRSLPRFPAVKRDLSLVVPANVTYQQIHAVVVASGGGILESVRCFDVFESKSAAPADRSLGIRLRFRSERQTLSEESVAPVMQGIVSRLADDLQVVLRAGG